MKPLALILALAATPAAAQTMHCMVLNNHVWCSSPPAPRVRDEAYLHQLQTEQTRRHVGALLQAGDCAGAQRYALAMGDLDAAANVAAICGR